LEKAMEMMLRTTHLSMMVRANRMGFREALLFSEQQQNQIDSSIHIHHQFLSHQEASDTEQASSCRTNRNIVATRAIAAANGIV
jgi:hypothetical protein